MDYIEDDFTDALIDAVCEKSPRNWYTLVGENFDPDEETIVKEANNKKDIEDAFNESKDDFDSLYVVLNDESYVAYSKGSKLIWKQLKPHGVQVNHAHIYGIRIHSSKRN